MSVPKARLSDKLAGGVGGPKSKSKLERKLRTDLNPWHDRQVASSTKKRMKALVRDKAQTASAAANRLLGFIKRVVHLGSRSGHHRGRAHRRHHQAQQKAAARAVHLPIRDPLFWKSCDRNGDLAGRLFKFALVTGSAAVDPPASNTVNSERWNIAKRRKGPHQSAREHCSGRRLAVARRPHQARRHTHTHRSAGAAAQSVAHPATILCAS